MINLFLRAKHWQMFLLTFVVPLVLQVTFVVTIVNSLIQNHDPTLLLGYLKFIPLVVIIYMGAMFGWQWSVVMGLQKLVPPVYEPN